MLKYISKIAAKFKKEAYNDTLQKSKSIISEMCINHN